MRNLDFSGIVPLKGVQTFEISVLSVVKYLVFADHPVQAEFYVGRHWVPVSSGDGYNEFKVLGAVAVRFVPKNKNKDYYLFIRVDQKDVFENSDPVSCVADVVDQFAAQKDPLISRLLNEMKELKRKLRPTAPLVQVEIDEFGDGYMFPDNDDLPPVVEKKASEESAAPEESDDEETSSDDVSDPTAEAGQ